MKTCSEKALEWNVTPRTVNAMCKNGSSDTTIVATSDNRGEWEQFKIIKNDDGTVSF